MSEEVLYLSFNFDHSLLALGSTAGFKIYQVNPFSLLHALDLPSCGIVEVHETGELVALVGARHGPDLSPFKLVIWSFESNERLFETSFTESVRAVRFNSRRILAMTQSAIYIYDTATMRSLHTIRKRTSFEGLVALSNDPSACLLLYPCDPNEGRVQVYDCLGLYLIGEFKAHHGCLAKLSVTSTGNLAATASVRGTIIRVFSLPDMERMFTFKRGSSAAHIFDLAFVPNLPFLITTSDTGTVHVFMLDQCVVRRNIGAKKTWGSLILRSVLLSEAVDTTRSFLKVYLGHKTQGIATIVPGLLFAMSYTGKFQVFSVDLEKGGEGRELQRITM